MTHAKTNTQTQLNPDSGKLHVYHLIEVDGDGDELDEDILDSLWGGGNKTAKRSQSAPAGLNIDQKKKKEKSKIGCKGDSKQKALDTAEKALLEFDQTKRSLSFKQTMMSVELGKVKKVANTLALMLAPHLLLLYSSEYHDPAFNNHISSHFHPHLPA